MLEVARDSPVHGVFPRAIQDSACPVALDLVVAAALAVRLYGPLVVLQVDGDPDEAHGAGTRTRRCRAREIVYVRPRREGVFLLVFARDTDA